MMECKTFIGTPGGVAKQVNDLFAEIKSKGLGITLQSVTQSYDQTHGSMLLTIIYNTWEDLSHVFGGKEIEEEN